MAKSNSQNTNSSSPSKKEQEPKKGTYKMISTEWSVSFLGFSVLGLVFFGLITGLLEILGGNNGTMIINGLFGIIILVLFAKYQAIYTSKSSIKLGVDGISVEIYKAFGTTRREFKWNDLKEIGRGTQKGTTGAWKIPNKHYVMMKFEKSGSGPIKRPRRYFFFEADAFDQAAKLYTDLKYHKPQVPENTKLFEE
jgi:hypothetical protein